MATKTFEVNGDEHAFDEAKIAEAKYSGIFLLPVCITYRSTFGHFALFRKPSVSYPSFFGNDQYRTAEGYRLGKKSRAAINLAGETISGNDLALGQPGFQASYTR